MLNAYVSDNYSKLVRYASKYSNNPHDTVHAAYLKIINSHFVYENTQKTEAYFIKTIRFHALDEIKKDGKLESLGSYDVQDDYSHIEKVIMREKIEAITRLLDQFDRIVFELYLEGWNTREISRETGIKKEVFYHTQKRVKAIIKKYA